jgi:hypothetical protein
LTIAPIAFKVKTVSGGIDSRGVRREADVRMKRGYLLAAVVFAVVFCLVLVGCPKKPAGPPGGMGQGMPGMKGGMMPGMNAAGGAANAEVNAEEPADNAEVNAEEPADNAEANAEDTSIPPATKKTGGG